MVKVNSKPTLTLLTKRFMKINRGRNLIAVIAIVMTTVMFTSLFTATASLLKTDQQQAMRNAMDSSHISIQDLTFEQFEQLRQYPEPQRYGYTIFMTVADNQELRTSQTEMRYADENGAESYMCTPTTGSMPAAYDQIAMSTLTLDLLGVPHKVGSPVTLTYTLSGQQFTKTFTLSGYWKGDPLVMAQEIWVSEAFCLDSVKKATAESLSRGDYEGGYNLCFWFKSTFGIQHQLEKIEELYHISKTQADIVANPAFDTFGQDGFPFGTAAVVLAVIFLSGYLIIFNVFNISVKNDIRSYGLLKNIGTTGRQLKAVVRAQAMLLSAAGIPIGLLLGFLAGKEMTPYLVEGAANSDQLLRVQIQISANPLVFLAAALFSFCTVMIACQRPCRVVAGVSPVEAVRMVDEDSPVRPSGKKKAAGKVTPFYMALNNMRRTWKRSLAVVISLALPIIVLNSIYSIEQGFDFEQYTDVYISSDFNVNGCTNNGGSSNLNAITPAFVKDLKKQEQVETLCLVYESESYHAPSERGRDNLKTMIDLSEQEGILKGYQLEKEKAFLDNGQSISHVLAINEGVFDKMTFEENSQASWKEFQTGNYVIVEPQSSGFGNFYNTGDRVTVELGVGQSKEYTVLAVGKAPYDLQYPFGDGTYFSYSFYIPTKDFLEMGGNPNAMTVGIDVKEGADLGFSQWLADYVEDAVPSLFVDSRLSKLAECTAFANKYYLVLSLLGAILLIIGIMNFFNTSAVSILSRRKEFALLEAVGMTKKQVRRMLLTEGLFYLLSSVLLADTLGIPLVWKIMEETVGKAFYFHSSVTVLPSLLALPVLAVIATAIPLYNYWKMRGESIVERI